MRILFISYYFAPQNSIAAVRTTKIVKYLIKLGYDVDVVCAPSYFIDPILKKDLENIKNRYVVHGFKVYEEIQRTNINKNIGSKTSFKKVIKKHLKNILNVFFPNSLSTYLDLIDSLIWQHKAKLKILNKKLNYNIIISSFGPIGSHILGLKLKRKNKKSLWIADYRDPMIQEGQNKIVKLIYKYYQTEALKYADVSFCISQGLKEELETLTKKSKIYVVTNGYDSDDTKILTKKNFYIGKLIFSYCGALYSGKRDLSPLFSILKELVIENKIEKDLIIIVYAGSEYSVLQKMAKMFDFESNIINLGVVSRDQSLNVTNSSDIALLTTWNKKYSKGVITGKVYELILMKKPIFVFVNGKEKNSEIRKMIERLNAGIVFEEADKNTYSIMKNEIELVYQKKIEKCNIIREYNNNYRNEFNYENIVKHIDTIIKDNSKFLGKS
jgi:glycosyltransferase involved in cell wall biosynthesis